MALTGEGADEWLAGYPWYKVDRLLGCLDVIPGLPLQPVAAARLPAADGRAAASRWQYVRRSQDAVGGHNAWLDMYGLMSLAKLRFFSPWMREQLADHVPYDDLGLNLDAHAPLAPAQPRAVPRRPRPPAGPAAQRQGRPRGDELLGRDALPVPRRGRSSPSWPGCTRAGSCAASRDKYLLRRLAERWLPKSIAWRRKAMFRAPLDSFHLTSTAPPFVDQLLSPESLREDRLLRRRGGAALAAGVPRPAGRVDAADRRSRWAWSACWRRSCGTTPSSTAAWRICRARR